MSVPWGDIINAVVSLYGAGKGSGGTPNTYNVPLTPSEEQTAEGKKNLFNYSSAYVDQLLRGLGGLTPNYTLSSPLVGNSAFMGGVQVPKIDWSAMPAAPTMGGGAPPRGTPAAGVPTSYPGGGPTAQAGSAGDPFNFFPDTNPNAKNYTLDELKSKWPQAASLVASLSGVGIPVSAILSIVQRMFGTTPSDQPLPTADRGFGSIDTAPGGNDYKRLQFPKGGGYAVGPNGQVVEVIGPGNPSYKPVTYSDRDPGGMYNPNTGISSGITQPEGQGHGQGGFGYGWTYDDFYGGGFGGASGGGGGSYGGKYKP